MEREADRDSFIAVTAFSNTSFVADAAETAPALSAVLRAKFPTEPWSRIRNLVASGKVSLDGRLTLDPGVRVKAGTTVAIRLHAPNPLRAVTPAFQIVYEDAHAVVVDKPEGVSSVPYEPKETGTAMDLIRDVWRRKGRHATSTPLFVVHRIDKDTSGLLCFAKTKLAERGFHRIFKNHLADRLYVAVAHGHVTEGRFESQLVPDRGDGLRGSTRFPGEGQYSVTHVTPTETLPSATVLSVRLETGRTHQIRIHLAEAGAPLVGETVYIRDFERHGATPLPSRRLLLHAATLGFEHPITGQRLNFSADLPPDFVKELDKLRRR